MDSSLQLASNLQDMEVFSALAGALVTGILAIRLAKVLYSPDE